MSKSPPTRSTISSASPTSDLDVDTVGEAAALEELLRLGGSLGRLLGQDHLAFGADRTGEPVGAVAEARAQLDHAPCRDDRRQLLQQLADLRADDGKVALCAQELHLAQHGVGGARQLV
jgi:hypothetical protein